MVQWKGICYYCAEHIAQHEADKVGKMIMNIWIDF